MIHCSMIVHGVLLLKIYLLIRNYSTTYKFSSPWTTLLLLLLYLVLLFHVIWRSQPTVFMKYSILRYLTKPQISAWKRILKLNIRWDDYEKGKPVWCEYTKLNKSFNNPGKNMLDPSEKQLLFMHLHFTLGLIFNTGKMYWNPALLKKFS